MSIPAGEMRPAIARIWRGTTAAADADSYADYLGEAGIPPLEATALGVQMLRCDGGSETTFVTISWWESVEAMTRFTGGDPRQVHHLERDPEFLVALPERVEILDVKTTFGFPPAPGSPPDRDRPSRRLKIAHTIVI